MLNAHNADRSELLALETTIVDFHEILSLPRLFLEAWTLKVGLPRLRLLPRNMSV